ncbi:MAG: CHAP domain-containing protein [Candidatus Saccharimonas sp.]
MKLLSTTPVSKGIVTKSSLVALSVLMGISLPLTLMNRAFADQYDDQIRALQQQKAAYDSQANTLSAQAATLQEALDQIVSKKAAIMAQIALSQQQYDQLQAQIDKTKKDITDNKDALGQIIADMYVDDTITPLEMLASSNNIGDYVDKQTYREAMQSNITSTIKDINDLQKKLQNSQAEVAKVLEEQQSQKAQLAAMEAEQASLVEQTRGQEAAYQQLASNVAAQMANAAAQQRAYYAALRAQNGGSDVDSGVIGSFVYQNWSGNQGCGGDGYAYCGPMDTYADPWDLYNRECVSYGAWRISEVYHRRVQEFNGAGHAYQWPNSAAGAVRVYDPQPGDAVVLPRISGFAPYGHLMVVESPPSNGWVHVSQYNFYGSGEYSTMDIKTSGVIFLRFPSK